jgi:hypothetical protein
VGTPGRVLDALNRSRILIIKELEVLVLGACYIPTTSQPTSHNDTPDDIQ